MPKSRSDHSAVVIEWSSVVYGYDSVFSSRCASSFGDTISNCDASKLGRLSNDSPELRPTAIGEGAGIRRACARGGDDVDDTDEMLGLGLCRIEPRLGAPSPRNCDWLILGRACA